ncbi:MAG: hypothetical protein ACLFUU_08320, partial [Desulfobacteraceae bacterium]
MGQKAARGESLQKIGARLFPFLKKALPSPSQIGGQNILAILGYASAAAQWWPKDYTSRPKPVIFVSSVPVKGREKG